MTKKKKILFVTEALWVGGIETALINLLNQLDFRRNFAASNPTKGKISNNIKLCAYEKVYHIGRYFCFRSNKKQVDENWQTSLLARRLTRLLTFC